MSLSKKERFYIQTLQTKTFESWFTLEYIPNYAQDITIELFKSPHMDLFKKSSIDFFEFHLYISRRGSNGLFF